MAGSTAGQVGRAPHGKAARTEEVRTTAMIRHISFQNDEQSVIGVLDAAGLRGKYDVVYVPVSLKRKCNLGYAFVNFVSPQYVEECRALFEGRPFGSLPSEKTCEVAYANRQGKESVQACIAESRTHPQSKRVRALQPPKPRKSAAPTSTMSTRALCPQSPHCAGPCAVQTALPGAARAPAAFGPPPGLHLAGRGPRELCGLSV